MADPQSALQLEPPTNLLEEHDLDDGDSAEAFYRPQDRRRVLRNPVVRFLTKPSFQAQMAVVYDISRRGIALLVRTRLNVGTIMAIQLQGENIGLSCILSAEVKHVRLQNTGVWLIGCALSRNLSDGELASLQ